MITLNLSDTEAFHLRQVLDRITGHPTNSAREYTDAIAERLAKSGVPYLDDAPYISGDITFVNYNP